MHYQIKMTYEDLFEHDLGTTNQQGYWLFLHPEQYTSPPWQLSNSHEWINMLNSTEFYLYICREGMYPRLRDVEWKKIFSVTGEERFTEFRSAIQILNDLWLANNANAIDMLYKTLITEQYNPLHNYDKDSVITDTWGLKKTQNEFGERLITNTNGARQNKTKYGQFVINNKSERYHDDKSSSPYDSDNVFLSERVAHVPEQDGTQTEMEHDVTTNDNESVDSSKTNATQDVLTEEEHTDKHTEKTKGNIGVTTSAQMAEEEIELRTNNQFIMQVLRMYLKQCNTFH